MLEARPLLLRWPQEMSKRGFQKPLSRAESFAAKLGIKLPILLAPMAGACPPSLSIAVANAGGMGACGALLMPAASIAAWVSEFRQMSKGRFQINLWIPDPLPARNWEAEARQRDFLAAWGPHVAAEMGDAVLPNFEEQCRAMIDARPKVISSIMGVYPAAFVDENYRPARRPGTDGQIENRLRRRAAPRAFPCPSQFKAAVLILSPLLGVIFTRIKLTSLFYPGILCPWIPQRNTPLSSATDVSLQGAGKLCCRSSRQSSIRTAAPSF